MSAPKRKPKATAAKPPITIIDACQDTRIWAGWFKDPQSWGAWFAFLATMFGIPLTPKQVEVFHHCTGRTSPNPTGYLEATLICGRRAGKSLILALIAAYLAMFRNWSQFLTGGERGTIIIVAGDKKQGRAIFRYLKGLLSIPLFAGVIERETAEALDLSNGITIEILAANFRTLRSYTCVAALCDEEAFWPTDEGLSNPDIEVIGALKPTMATIPGAVLLKASSPYAKKGDLFEDFKRHYSQDDSAVLVWRADTRTMNPTVSERFIAAAYERDAAWAAAEYGAEFRSDLEAFLSRDAVDAVIPRGRRELPFASGLRYVAFTDPSGGSGGDSFTLAIAHLDPARQIPILDLVREARPPLSPAAIVAEFSQVLKGYGMSAVTGDSYAGDWPTERFAEHGITYKKADKFKSAIYQSVLPLINSAGCELLDHTRLIGQLCSLERRTARGGRDSIDHPQGQHDDLANSAAGALVHAASVKPPMKFAPPPDWSNAAAGYNSSTGVVHRNPALAHGGEYAGSDFVPHFPTKR